MENNTRTLVKGYRDSTITECWMLCLARNKSSDSFLTELIETNGRNGIEHSNFIVSTTEEWETLIES